MISDFRLSQVIGAFLSGVIASLFWCCRVRREAKIRREQFGLAAMVADVMGVAQVRSILQLQLQLRENLLIEPV